MKNLFWLFSLVVIFSCKNDKNRFDVDVSHENIKAKITDISADVYNTHLPFDSLKTRYPFFFDPKTPDETYIKQRTDSLENLIYSDVKKTIDLQKLTEELTVLFQHIKYYYPKFESPTIYTFSSVIDESYTSEPVRYFKDANVLFIALDYFLGNESEYYKVFKVPTYLRESMNPENICPKASLAIAETFPLMDIQNNQFLNYLITYGKAMLLQDAFLPGYSDALKIGYTPEQIEWCFANERNMWDYFIRQDYLFSDDKDLLRRFISPGPFSKFYIMDEDNESVDVKSPGGVGKWLGWQILRSYTKNNPKVSIVEIMANRNFEELFKQSQFQPK